MLFCDYKIQFLFEICSSRWRLGGDDNSVGTHEIKNSGMRFGSGNNTLSATRTQDANIYFGDGDNAIEMDKLTARLCLFLTLF